MLQTLGSFTGSLDTWLPGASKSRRKAQTAPEGGRYGTWWMRMPSAGGPGQAGTNRGRHAEPGEGASVVGPVLLGC